jgi:hypothetical protein
MRTVSLVVLAMKAISEPSHCACCHDREICWASCNNQSNRSEKQGCAQGSTQYLQDFNKQVLTAATMPNVALNCTKYDISLTDGQPLFVAGDFLSTCKYLAMQPSFVPFDLVLTSESIYNMQSAKQLLQGCGECMRENGCLLLAAKSHYFGVGGGLAAFKRLAEVDGQFVCSVVSRIDDGASNVREILCLHRRGMAQM